MPSIRRKKHTQVHLRVLHVDRRGDRLSHRLDVEVELVAGPPALHVRTTGDVLRKLVDVVGDAAPRLVLAEVMRKIDVDGL